jgi:Cu(I)/Ag(I) efflux system membrane fusion protein
MICRISQLILAVSLSVGAAPDADPYPLNTCPVTGEKLGSMGDPIVRVYDGREIRFCCGGCPGTFEKDNAAFLKKIDEAIIRAQVPLYPLDTCLVTGGKLGDKPIDLIHGHRLVRLRDLDAVKEFQKDPAKVLAKLDAAAIAGQKPAYPLTTCVVTGEKLGGDMGEPVDYLFAGRLVRFCCKGCIAGFLKDPWKHLEKIDAALREKGKGVSPPPKEAPTAQAAPPAPRAKAATRYYCPMHPTYISDRPGDCPICNMTLVPLKEVGPDAGPTVEGRAPVAIQPERLQLIGVRTAAAEKKRFSKTIRTAGRVEIDEKSIAVVNLKVGGWVEELHVKSVGEPVRKGQPILSLYSPELLEAQQNYLLAREASDERTLRAARDRLLLWDVAEEQIRALEEKKEPLARVPLLSKVEGVVTRRNVAQGTFVERGRDLLEIVDLSKVWILADVYEYEVPEVKVGQTASAHLSALPGESVGGKIVFIYPTLNEATRTVRVRLEVPNAEGKLKPGMYAEVTIPVDLGEQIVVDDQAIVDTGARQIVFVDKGGGRLEPRAVTAGARSGGLAVILQGLQQGERVVTSGNFLIDSESRLRAALRAP